MELLTVNETARMLRVSPITIRRYVASGRLEAVRVGRSVRIERAAIDRFAEPMEQNGATSRSAAGRGELPTIRESLGNIVGIGRSGESTNIAEHKDEYLADAFAATHE